MKIAYIVLAHSNVEQVLRLANSISNTGDVYIHFDKKCNIDGIEKKIENNPSVNLVEKRIMVSWAGWSVVKAYITSIIQALESPKKYDRFVMLTGQDYPLMKDSQIIDEFEKNKDIEYIMAYNVATSTILTDKNKTKMRWYMDSPFKLRFLHRAYKSFMYRFVTKVFKRKDFRVPLNGKMVNPYFGQMLSAFTRQGAELIVNTYLTDKKYNKRMKNAHAPDELYWQTIIFNSDLRKNTIQHGEEHEITEHFGWAPLHYHTYTIDTSIYTEKDFDELKNSGYMFCRKVVPGVSDSLMDKIDEMRR